MRFYTILILIAAFVITVYPQKITKKNYHAFSGTFVLSIEGGSTFLKSDYYGTKVDYLGKGSFEYFLPSFTNSSFGFRAFGGGGFLSENDTRKVPALIKTDIAFAGAGVVYALSIKQKVFPYIFAGAAYTWFNPKDENGNKLPDNLAGNYSNQEINFLGELGFRFLITDNLSFNINGGVQVSPNDNFDDLMANANNDLFFTAMGGFSFSFFTEQDTDGDGVVDSKDACEESPIGVKVDEFGCPVDSDKDGIADYLDDCPDTPVDVKVKNNGCPKDEDDDGVADYLDLCSGTPKGVEVDEFGCPFDRDADGVPDYQDECPKTPYDVAVNKRGCPIDSDLDGIPDYLDKCPDSKPGVEIDEDGCEKKEAPEVKEFVLSAATSFEFGKTKLSPSAYPELNNLIEIMNEFPESRWRIEGHTDNIGSDQANKKVSLERAQSVLNYFLSKGLDRERFEVYGMGEDFPIATNKTEEGRAKNRRVKIIRID